MDISVIIVSWNVKNLLQKCLESIFKHTQKENTPAIGVFSGNSTKSVSGISGVNHLGYSIADSKNLSSASQMDGTGLEPAFPEVVNPGAYQLAEPPKGAAFDIIPQFEIIVVDNASSDGTVEMVKEMNRHAELACAPRARSASEFEDRSRNKFGMTREIKLIANDKNRGFAAGNNQGIREAKGKYILLLNPDTEFTENSLKKVFDAMESDASIGVLGCTLLNPDGSLQPSVRRFPRLRDIIIIFFKLHKLFPSLLNRYLAKNFDYDHPLAPSLVKEGEVKEVDQIMGAFFCIRKSVIDRIGLLDDKYFIWFEEVDFCRRAKAAGFKVVYWPGTSIIHHGGQSFGQAPIVKKQWWFFRSAWRYLTK